VPEGERPDKDTAFEALVASEHAALLRRAGDILKDDAEAEDVVQETLAAVYERLPAVPRRKLKAYLFRAVQFNALKRRARRRGYVSLDAVGERPAPTAGTDPTETIDPFELEQALTGLPKTQQTVLRMKYYLGMTFREIGETLSISANTAASRCRYALRTLRRVLGGRGRKGG